MDNTETTHWRVEEVDGTLADLQAKIATGFSIVDFWGEHCDPCKRMLPVFAGLSSDPELSHVRFVKAEMQVQAHADLMQFAGSLGIMSIPCFIVFQDGKTQWREWRKIGSVSPADMKAFILSIAK